MKHDPEFTPFTAITLLLIGVVAGFFGFASILHFAPPKIMQSNCTWCHKQPPLNTVKKYKTYHRTKPENRAALLKELEAAR